MLSKVKLFKLLFLFVSISSLKAQTDAKGYAQNFTTASPSAFAFSKIDNVPVNLFTGRISLNIPVYEKKMSVLHFNMALGYSGGGGIKKDERSTLLGKSWLLDVGGIITRNKRGIPDDYKTTQSYYGSVPSKYNGVLYNGGVTYKADGVQRCTVSDPTFDYQDGTADAQHDIFEFNVFGKTGKFYIGKDQQVLIVTDSKMKIIPDFTSSSLSEFKLGSFLLIDENGVNYYFNEIEKENDPLGSNDNNALYYNKDYASSWLLTKVEAPFSEESITFQYVEGLTSNQVSSGVYYNRSDLANGSQSSAAASTVKEKNIQSITFSDNWKINFKYFQRSGYPDYPLLNSLEVVNSNSEVVKSYSFNYKRWGGDNATPKLYYTDAMNPLDISYSPRDNFYLSDISSFGTNGGKQKIYGFDYFLDANLNEVTAYGTGNGIDYLGYYNGKANNTKFVIPTQWGPAADRSPDFNFAKLGALKKIIYPTGGSEEFEYELNDKRGSPANIALPGLRIKKRILHDGISANNDIIKEYKYIEPDNLSSGFLGDMPEFTFTKNVYYDDGGWPSTPHLKYTTTTSFTDPVNPFSNIEGSFVGYRRVEELQQNGTKNNGKVVYEYSDLNYTSLWIQSDYYPYRPVDRPFWAVGLLLKKSYFLSDGTTMLKQTVNDYNIFQQEKIDDNYRSLHMSKDGEVDIWLPDGSPDPGSYRYIFKFSNYYPIVGRTELKSVHEYDYSLGLTKDLFTQDFYDANYYVLRNTIQTNSKGETVGRYFYYPFDYNLGTTSFATMLVSKNMINQPITNETWITKPSGSYLLNSEVTEHDFFGNGVIRPSKIQTSRLAQPLLGTPGLASSTVLLPSSRSYQPSVTFSYDGNSRLVELQKEGGLKSAIILDQSGNVVAKAENSSYDKIAYTGFETTSTGNWTYDATGINNTEGKVGVKSYNGIISKSGLSTGNYTINLWAKGIGSVTINGTSKTINSSWSLFTWSMTNITSVSINTNGNLIDEVSLSPANAFLSTKAYDKELVVSSETDVNNKIKWYEYDEFYRLKNIKDQNGKIIKSFGYQYVAPFANISTSASVTRSTGSCPVGDYIPGPAVTYTVPAGKYSSIISQADADGQAQSDMYVNGQAYADQYGTCNQVFYNDILSAPYTRNNCPEGTVPEQVYYTVAAKKYSSIINQADADSKAQDDVKANGQNYANSTGTCAVMTSVSLYNNTSDNFTISFDGLGTSYNYPPGTSNISIPSGVYTVHISQVSTAHTHNFYVGSRSSVTGVFADFSNVNVTTGAGAETNFGIY
jgi:hypothetical protein